MRTIFFPFIGSEMKELMRKNRTFKFVIASTLLIALASLVYQLPTVNTRLSWRIDAAQAYLRGIVNPVEALPTANAQIAQSEVDATPFPTGPTATPLPPITPTATPATPEPTQFPTPTPTPLPEFGLTISRVLGKTGLEQLRASYIGSIFAILWVGRRPIYNLGSTQTYPG